MERINRINRCFSSETVPETKNKKFSNKQLLAMTKSEQVALLEKLGAEEIPRYEKDRVTLILKLQ